ALDPDPKPPAAGLRPDPTLREGPTPSARELPAAHQRPPDRAAPVQVVRPAGRSTWTGAARPGRENLRDGKARPPATMPNTCPSTTTAEPGDAQRACSDAI